MPDLDFKEVNPEQYFDPAKAMTVQKTATISARPASTGEEIATVMKDGHMETKNIAKAGDFVVTNPGGEQYIVPGDKFLKKYMPTDNPNIYKPNAPPVQAMTLTEDVKFKAPWGEEMAIKKGGVLVRSGPNDIYGIQPEEFKETYSVINRAEATAAATKDVVKSAKTAGNDVRVAERTVKSTAEAAAERGGRVATAAAEGIAEAGGKSVLRTVGEVAGKVAVPLTIAVGAAEVGYDVHKGNYKGATKSATGTAVALAGGEVGAEAGAAAGAAIGSIVPVLGTAAGAVVGGIVGGVAGGIAGYYGGSKLGEKAYDVVKDGAIGVRGELSKVYNWFSSGNAPAVASAPAMNIGNQIQSSVSAPRIR